jgi:hypothetical protein
MSGTQGLVCVEQAPQALFRRELSGGMKLAVRHFRGELGTLGSGWKPGTLPLVPDLRYFSSQPTTQRGVLTREPRPDKPVKVRDCHLQVANNISSSFRCLPLA